MNFPKIFFFIFFIVFSGSCIADTLSGDEQFSRDSLIKEINVDNELNSAKKKIEKLINSNFIKDPNFVIEYVENNILDNSKYKSDTVFYANVINTYANSFFSIDLNKCVQYLKLGIDFIGNNQNPKVLNTLALLSTNLANSTGSLGYGMTKLKMLIDLAPTIVKVEDPLTKRNYHHRLGGAYYDYNEHEKSIEHYKQGVFTKDDFRYNPNLAGLSELMIASNYMKLGEIDSLKKYVQLANRAKLPELHIIHQSRLKNLLGLSEAYKGNFSLAYTLIDSAYGKMSAPQTYSASEMMYAQFMKAKVLALQNQHQKAVDIFNTILLDSSLDHYRTFVLKALSTSYIALSQFKNANLTNEALVKFLEDEKKKNQDLYIEELNYSYKFNEKLNEIEKLKFDNEKAEVTKERNNLFIFSLLSFLLLLSVVLFLVIKAHKRNKLLSVQEYDLLKASLEEEKNNRLISEMKLLMQIEDRERNRIATDLHDSIGGLLSSIKISIFNYQESRDLPPDDLKETDRIIEYLDESKQELNRIVYNLTPIIVEKFGLLESIKQYCKKVQNDKFKINLQLISVPTNLVSEDEITLYRIIQENIHNIIKHANASKALLQIQTDDTTGMVVISIEDNGVGFDLEKAKIKGGLGMRSLYSRVQNLKGTIKIDSILNEGTSVLIVCYPRIRKEDS